MGKGRQSVVDPISYEGSDDEDIDMVPKHVNIQNDYNIISDSDSD